MQAAIFRLELDGAIPPRDRWRCGRSLAAELDALQGFVAFLAFETAEGGLAGLCICVDAAALAEAQQVAEIWQRTRSDLSGSGVQPIVEGEVIVQRGF